MRALLALAALAVALTLAAAGDAAVEAELARLRASIDEAESGLAAAHNKKDVVDLGASMRLVEGRFAGLKSALLAEMGVAGERGAAGGSGAAVTGSALEQHAKELTNKGGELINKLGTSRAQVHLVLAEVRVMDRATAELKSAITQLEAEIAELGNVLSQAHVDNSVLFSAHSELRDAVADVHSHSAALPEVGERLRGAMVPKWYYLVFAEFGFLVVFGGYKVYWMRRREKFNKLG